MLDKYSDVLDVKDLMKILKLGRTSVYNLLSNKKINSKKYGKKYIISKENLIKYIRQKD